EALRARGVDTVDAPVSGAAWGAERAELVFMVGGDPASVARARPLFDVMGRKVFHLGGVGAGHKMKSINNLITAMTLLATAEGLALGTKLGLDPNVMTDVLNEATGMSWISRTHIKQRVTSRTFDDPFKLELMVKDIRIAMELAQASGVPMPFNGSGRELWQRAGAAAPPGASVSELVRWVERECGVEIRPQAKPVSDTFPAKGACHRFIGRGSGDLLGLVRFGRADDRLRDRRAVDHLVERDRERLAARGGLGERFERRARHVAALGLPRLRRPLHGLEHALAEQPRAPLLGGRAGDVRHALEPHVALRAVHLEAEAAAGRRHR